MPALMLTIMFYTCFYRYFADGPLFPRDVGDAGNCRINWWVDLLMVHNLVRTEYLVGRVICSIVQNVPTTHWCLTLSYLKCPKHLWQLWRIILPPPPLVDAAATTQTT